MEISREGLQIVKSALEEFKNEIQGSVTTARSQSQRCLTQCGNIVKDTAEHIERLEVKIKQLKNRIYDLDRMIADFEYQLQAIESKLPYIEENIQQTNERKNLVVRQIEGLRVQLSQTDDEDEKRTIQNKIFELQSRVDMLQGTVTKLENEESVLREKKKSLQKEKEIKASEKSKCEGELSIETRRLNKYQIKKEKLDVAYRNLDSDFIAYIQAVGSFEHNAEDSISAKHHTIEECIGIIEEIESVF